LKRNYDGCALCNSTWGNVWAEVDGERTFFCCELCVAQFRGLVDRIKRDTGWTRIDSLEIEGDRRGRACEAAFAEHHARYRFAFTGEGDLLYFRAEENA
jgi:hypothetical protein